RRGRREPFRRGSGPAMMGDPGPQPPSGSRSRPVSLACPSCGRSIAIKDVRPGRFRVPCPECGRPFGLEVVEGDPPRLTAPSLDENGPTPATDPMADAGQIARRLASTLLQRLAWAARALTSRKSTVGGALILSDLGRTSLGAIGLGRQLLIGRDVLVR